MFLVCHAGVIIGYLQKMCRLVSTCVVSNVACNGKSPGAVTVLQSKLQWEVWEFHILCEGDFKERQKL